MIPKRAFGRSCFALETLEPRQLLAADAIVINEIMYHQASGDTGQEFIELHNFGETSEDLTDWSFTSGVAYTLPAVTIPAGGYLVVAADVTAFGQLYPDVTNVVGGWSGRLANRGEAITLVDSLGQQVDRVRYADEGDWATRFLGPLDEGHRGWRWLAPHDGDGKSLELRNALLSNDFGHNWSASISDGGTPGTANSMRSVDIAPGVATLQHAPVIPSSSDQVTVSMRVLDEELSTVSATLYFRNELDADFQSTPLTRNGEMFEATIPTFEDRTIVEYYVTVADASGNSRSVPTFESDDATRTANRLYQVLDAALSVAAWDPSAQSITYLVMRQSEQDILADIGDGPLAESESNAQMNGTYVRVDGNSTDVRYNVGVRNRGGASRVGPPNNYRINFPQDTPLEGATSLNINALFTHVETIGNAVYRLAGLPAPEVIPIQTRVNGLNLADPLGRMFGSYAETEVITGSFPDRYFPDDNRGNLYRVIEANREFGALGYAGNDPENYQENFSKRTNEEEGDWSDVIDLLNVLNNVPEADFVSEVQRVLDVDQWMRYLALDSLLGNSETGLNAGRADKFWLYRGIQDTRFKLIPHDLDTILDIGRNGEPNRGLFSNYVEVQGLRRLLTHEEFVPRYYQAFVDLIEDVFNAETLHPLIDRLVGYVPEYERNNMKQFVVDRIAGVQAQLPLDFVVATSLPIVAGLQRTALPAAEVVGIANSLKTKSVLVNGHLANWSRATREWSVPIVGDGTVQTLVAQGADWRYFDQGPVPSSAWRNSQFNDDSWKQGPAPLGYGEGDEATVVSFGSSPFNKHITTYFRHRFDVSEASQVLDLTMRLVRDDGVIVYLNGQEVVRDNMPDGVVDARTVASSWIGGSAEGQQLSFSIDPSLLVDGTNTLAVEIHQVDSVDSDLRFDLSLEASVGTLTGGVPLNPGVNRVHVSAFDGFDGTGNVVDEGFVDIWYDGSSVLDAETCSSLAQFGVAADAVMNATTLSQDTVFAPCGPAYRVTGEIVVPTGVVLTVLPGTTIFFEENAGFSFEGGQLIAEGTPFETIRFTRAPDVRASWSGLQFTDSTVDNRISHAVLEHATSADGMIGLRGSKLEVNHTTFDHANLFRLVTVDSSLTVRDSIFTDMFAPGEPPLTDNSSEHIKGSGILDGGQLLLEGNYFGKTTGHNDAVDFDGAALPGPIPKIVGNYFAGSGDDALDLETDAWIEHNTFVDVRKDSFNTSTGDANAISAGDGRTYYAYRNRFYNVDHAVQVKDEAFLYFGHNSVDTVHISPIYFDLPDRTPGRGALVTDSIFSNTPVTFAAADQAQTVEANNSLVTADALDLGSNNFFADAKLVDPAHGDFRLTPGSAAAGKAFAGLDLGAVVPSGVQVDNQPAKVTGRRSTMMTVGGPGIAAFRYRVGGGDWSEPLSTEEPIQLNDLTHGTHRVEVQGRTVTGWQETSTIVEWQVDTSLPHLYISEVLASNDSVPTASGTPDLIELHNDSDVPVDLSGRSISDSQTNPRKYVFSENSIIPAGGYIVLEASDRALGFKLDAEGEGVYLFDRIEDGGGLLDSVEFGIQITDLSISRIGVDRNWHLSLPTFGAANQIIATGRTSELRINEWLASSDQRFTGDFLELYNRDDAPVSLEGLYLTDDPIAFPTKHEMAPLSFIAARGFVTFDPGGNPENGANELQFGISKNGELLALLDTQQRPIDQVLIFDQTIDVSQGRVPDGGNRIEIAVLATPGNPNPLFETTADGLFQFTDPWRYDQSGNDLGIAWRQAAFDDSNWPSGPGPLGVTAGELSIPIQTPLEVPREREVVTHYFRRDFPVDPQLLADGKTVFELSTLVDDGAVFFINGVEFLRSGMPDGEVTAATTANVGVGIPEVEGPHVVPHELLRAGNNQIAVEVHQVSRRNSDVVFGAQLLAKRTSTSAFYEIAIALQHGLRISEIMYHPAVEADAEFIELTNISDEPLNVANVSLAGDVEITLNGGLLAPGEHAVLAANVDAFRAAYGDEIRILGTYRGLLPNGKGELTVQLPTPLNDAFDAAILRVAYDDDWYPTTDGDGYSLQIRSELDGLAAWNQASGWRASQASSGTPGQGEVVLGDFDADGLVNIADVDLLGNAIASASSDLRFDLDGDGAIGDADLDYLVEGVLRTRPGDVDLNGTVDFADFLALSAHFGHNDGKWSTGDLDADGRVSFADFLLLSMNFGFRRDEL